MTDRPSTSGANDEDEDDTARALWLVAILARLRLGAFTSLDEFLSVILDVNRIFSHWKFFLWNVHGRASFL